MEEQWRPPVLRSQSRAAKFFPILCSVSFTAVLVFPQMKRGSDPPEVSFFLLIHNVASPALGSNLSQVSVRDSISGIVPVQSVGREVERGFQSFTIDALHAGSQVVLNYSAHITSTKSGVLELPAFLTFSNASQNDVNMFGPCISTFARHCIYFVTDHQFADCDGSADNLKDEAALENKMVDVMLLEEPQDMAQALESLEMSSLLHASNHLEAARLQIHKALLVALLSQEGRLLEVVQGQVMAAEGRLKEQLEAKMAALATRCNRETRDAMEAELHRQRKEQERAERLCQRAEPQNVLQCSLLLEKLHSLSQSRMQRHLLVRHEEASARVQREITEQRRAELHMIFSEELEEARGLERWTTARQLHCCTTLVLAERQAQRSFLVQSLQSIHSLISETFNSCSRALDDWLFHVRGCLEPLCDRAQQQVVLLRQRLEEALTEEKRALRCGLLQRRRERLSDMYCVHRQQLKALSSSPLPLDQAGLLQMFERWRNLLLCQCSEVSELVNRLDEEAAADIRKVTSRAQSHSAVVGSVLQAAFPPGERHLLQMGHTAPTQDPAQTDRLEAQMGTTREQLQGALQRELREQRDTRDKCRRLCSCQLALSEADLLQMKLEFHKCFCVMDRCLVLPPAVHRAKLHCALEEWSSEQEALMVKVWEQMQLDRQTSLHSQACVLSSRLLSGQLEKVQRRSRALQTWTALVSLQSLLIPELAQRDNMADVVHAHGEVSHLHMKKHLQQWLKMGEIYTLILFQELEFVCELVKLSEVPPDVLRETLRLLLPSLPESELLSVTEALCPKQSSGSSSTWNNCLAVKLREDVIRKEAGFAAEAPPSARAPPPLKLHPDETRPSDCPSPGYHGDDPTVRLFVFRDPPPPLHVQTPEGAARKRRRNFLNFKKNSVVPTL
uniref:Limbin n=1 Tax=Neogobius melanostomus TaxID=47308 RepID=A0A8C6U393_9GOBI